MEVKELLNKKHELEKKLACVMSVELDLFEKETGFSIKDVSVDIFEIHTLGKKQPVRVVERVSCEIDLTE